MVEDEDSLMRRLLELERIRLQLSMLCTSWNRFVRLCLHFEFFRKWGVGISGCGNYLEGSTELDPVLDTHEIGYIKVPGRNERGHRPLDFSTTMSNFDFTEKAQESVACVLVLQSLYQPLTSL